MLKLLKLENIQKWKMSRDVDRSLSAKFCVYWCKDF